MKKVLALTLLMIVGSISTISAHSKEKGFDKTDEVLAKAAEKAINLAEKTGEFVIEQAPELLKEFYQWHIFSNIFAIILSVIFILLARYLPNLWLYKEEQSGTWKDNYKFFNMYGEFDKVFPAWIVFSIIAIVCIIVILVDLYDLIYILIAPKLYLIDYFIK